MANTTSAGIVVCITTTIDNNDDEDFGDSGYMSVDGMVQDENVDLSESEAAVRALWSTLKDGVKFEKAEPREYLMVKEQLKGEGEKESMVRMWCELFRNRG